VQSITLYLFFAGIVGMGAGAVYLFFERSNVPSQYRSAVTVSGLICAIACFHYYKMTIQYMTGGSFSTALRYIDWLFTTPLLLIKFPMLLRLESNGKNLFRNLVLLDIGMIVTAFIAETSPVGGGSWWGFFLVACAFELGIVSLLYGSMSDVIKRQPAPIASAIRTMRLFILFGWAVYPIGFLMALGGAGEYREIVYNISDVVNKVGFGLVALHGIQTFVKAETVRTRHPELDMEEPALARSVG